MASNDAPAFIQNPVESCPQTKMVLGGYSQGAAVVDILTATARPILGFTSPLPETVADQIAAVAVFAGTPFPHQVPATVAAFGTERLLDGSDYCFTPAHGVDAQLASIEQADQPADDSWRALTTRNANRLLGATETAR